MRATVRRRALLPKFWGRYYLFGRPCQQPAPRPSSRTCVSAFSRLHTLNTHPGPIGFGQLLVKALALVLLPRSVDNLERRYDDHGVGSLLWLFQAHILYGNSRRAAPSQFAHRSPPTRQPARPPGTFLTEALNLTGLQLAHLL
jgi:hypothetical protein